MWIVVTRLLEPDFQSPTLFALYQLSHLLHPLPHLTPVNSWEVTVIFAERQLKGWAYSLAQEVSEARHFPSNLWILKI